MKYPKTLDGLLFGRLTIVKEIKKGKNNIPIYECKCSCGNIKITNRNFLVTNSVSSCGCLRKIYSNPYEQKLHKKLYIAFKNLKNRCSKKNNPDYKYYGGRGISCKWNNFKEFFDDMNDSFILHVKEFGIKDTSIDRIDVNKNYCKENCRWATSKEQNNNRRYKRKPICCPNCKFEF